MDSRTILIARKSPMPFFFKCQLLNLDHFELINKKDQETVKFSNYELQKIQEMR
jgi:hypothetical protein